MYALPSMAIPERLGQSGPLHEVPGERARWDHAEDDLQELWHPAPSKGDPPSKSPSWTYHFFGISSQNGKWPDRQFHWTSCNLRTHKTTSQSNFPSWRLKLFFGALHKDLGSRSHAPIFKILLLMQRSFIVWCDNIDKKRVDEESFLEYCVKVGEGASSTSSQHLPRCWTGCVLGGVIATSPT